MVQLLQQAHWEEGAHEARYWLKVAHQGERHWTEAKKLCGLCIVPPVTKRDHVIKFCSSIEKSTIQILVVFIFPIHYITNAATSH